MSNQPTSQADVDEFDEWLFGGGDVFDKDTAALTDEQIDERHDSSGYVADACEQEA